VVVRGVLRLYIQMRYEWDETKNRLNQKKHGVSFEVAALAMEDENCSYGRTAWTKPASSDGTQLGRRGSRQEREWCFSWSTSTERKSMARKSSASSRPAGLTSMTSKDIKNRKWTEAERRSVKHHATIQAAGDDSDINYDDIPKLTEKQLAQMVRLRDLRPKVPVSVRLDPRVLEWLKSKGEGHLTRINDILRIVMEAEQRLVRRS